LCLDEASLPAHDSNRLAIVGKSKTLKQIGDEVLHAIAGTPIPQWHYECNENEPI